MIQLHTSYETAEEFQFPGPLTVKLLLSPTTSNGTMAIFQEDMPAGKSSPRHFHDDQDETFLFIEGTFQGEIDGKLLDFKAGDTLFVPRGVIHSIKNVGDTTGKLIFVFSPANTIVELFREASDLFKAGKLTMEAMIPIGAKHGQHLAGPPLESFFTTKKIT